MDTIMDMGNVTIGDIIPRVDNGINGIILFIILILTNLLWSIGDNFTVTYFSRAIKCSFIIGEKR